MHRRDFLDPRRAASAAGPVLALTGPLPDVPAQPPPDEIAIVRLGWRAMATTYEIVAPFDAKDLTEAGRDAFALLDALEDQLTVYRDHSEVSRLNRAAPHRAVQVEA